jgi:DNA polymerase-4
VSCERLTNSKNWFTAYYYGGDRGVVASCSYEARTFGVRSAMPIKMALRLCPQAKVMKGDMYSKLSRYYPSHRRKAPIVEKASIDEFYLDITEWIGFMAVTSGQMNSQSITKKQDCR